ncbi:hypothetical protein BH10ACT2_BH10ACT2_24510 [soil metagenome]
MGFLGLIRPKSASGADLLRKAEQIRPRTIGIVTAALALLFVVARLLVAADGDISRFVVAGNVYTNAAQLQPAIHVLDSAGYDGQFYWRLATNPTELQVADYRGVQLDAQFRITRIAYPTIAWAISFGQANWAKWSLVITNIAGLGIIGYVGANLARNRGRAALAGVAVASSSGLIFSLSRDLCEIAMVAALVAGVAMIARRQHALAAACWTLACLVHEQALFCVVPYALYRLVGSVRRREWSPTVQDLPWLVSLTAFGAWQLICRSVVGKFPVLSAKGGLAVPFTGFVEQVHHWTQEGIGLVEALVVPQLALLVTLVVIAFRSSKTLHGDDQWLRWALVGATAITVSLSRPVWVDPAALRQLVVLSTIAWLVIVLSGRRIPVMLVGATGLVWILTAAVRVVEI